MRIVSTTKGAAADWLAERTRPSTPIVEIALSCGFASQSHFASTFHRQVGVTPTNIERAGPVRAHGPQDVVNLTYTGAARNPLDEVNDQPAPWKISPPRALASLPLADRAVDRPGRSKLPSCRRHQPLLPLLIAATFNGMAVAAAWPGYVCFNGVSTRAPDRRIETMP